MQMSIFSQNDNWLLLETCFICVLNGLVNGLPKMSIINDCKTSDLCHLLLALGAK